MDRTNIGCIWSSGAQATFLTGTLAEVGIINAVLDQTQIVELAAGRTLPEVVPMAQILAYLPLRMETGERDLSNASTIWTNSGAFPVRDHPPLLVPNNIKRFSRVPAAGGNRRRRVLMMGTG